MDIKWLKTFIIAAKHENFRKTAEELFLTQPAITKHIKRLEEDLHIFLFKRVGKKITLTSAGHHFLPYAKAIMTTYEKGLEDFELWKQGYHRKLVIAIAPQIASSILPSILRVFIEKNPYIEVIINVLKSYEIGEEVNAGKADLGLTRIRPIQTNINCHIVHEEPVILVGPKEELIEGSCNELSVLNRYRLITHNHPDYWDTLLNDIKRHYPNVRTMEVNQMEITKRFIEEGLGVSYIPSTLVREEIRNNQLTEIRADRIIPPRSSTYVLTKVETKEARIFIDFFTTALANNGEQNWKA